MPKRHTFHPTGTYMTLDDMAEFVAEMISMRNLPGTTVVRSTGAMEIDVDGPRVKKLTACPEDNQDNNEMGVLDAAAAMQEAVKAMSGNRETRRGRKG